MIWQTVSSANARIIELADNRLALELLMSGYFAVDQLHIGMQILEGVISIDAIQLLGGSSNGLATNVHVVAQWSNSLPIEKLPVHWWNRNAIGLQFFERRCEAIEV